MNRNILLAIQFETWSKPVFCSGFVIENYYFVRQIISSCLVLTSRDSFIALEGKQADIRYLISACIEGTVFLQAKTLS